MDQVLEVLVGGAAQGAVYATVALGLALVYGVSRIFNWAYGSFFLWTAYLIWFMVVRLQFPYVVAGVAAALLVILGALVVERIALRRARRASDWQTATMMATLGLALVLDNAAIIVFGPERVSVPAIPLGTVAIGNFAVTGHDVVTLLAAVSLVIAVDSFIKRTRLGTRIRAVAQDPTGAEILGIDLDRISAFAFALSAGLVAVAAFLLIPTLFITPATGWNILIKAFVVVSFAGLGHVRGILPSAFALAAFEALVGWQLGLLWVAVFWLGALLVVLSIRSRNVVARA